MTTPKPQGSISLRRLLPLLVILFAAIAGFFTLGDYLSFESLREHRDALNQFRDQNYVLAVLGFMAIYITIVAFSLPGATIASLTGGFLFGLTAGVMINVTSATIGAVIIFLAARYGLGNYLAGKLESSEGTIGRFREGLRENEISYLFLMRLVPAIPFFAANLIPALVGVRLSRFVFTTFFGIIPGGIILTWIGVGLGEVFARGDSPDLGVIFEPQILGPILGLSVLAVLPIVIRKFGRKKGLGDG